jgi:hypothetical protein
MNDIPIQAIDIDQKDYWLIRTSAVEWLYLIRKIIRTDKTKPPHENFVVLIRDKSWLYMLKRAVFAKELLMATLGVTADQLEPGKVFVLDPPSNVGLPEPTVPYYGEA